MTLPTLSLLLSSQEARDAAPCVAAIEAELPDLPPEVMSYSARRMWAHETLDHIEGVKRLAQAMRGHPND